ncbi:MAG: hypothetical protein AAFY98_03125 [Verrucomicrobiota bacterium]
MWPNKDQDPLAKEIEKLAHQRKQLEKQAQLLEEEITNPVIREEREIQRGAKILNDRISDRSPLISGKKGRNSRKLRKQQRVARNRVIAAFLVLLLLLFVLYKLT